MQEAEQVGKSYHVSYKQEMCAPVLSAEDYDSEIRRMNSSLCFNSIYVKLRREDDKK